MGTTTSPDETPILAPSARLNHPATKGEVSTRRDRLPAPRTGGWWRRSLCDHSWRVT